MRFNGFHPPIKNGTFSTGESRAREFVIYRAKKNGLSIDASSGILQCPIRVQSAAQSHISTPSMTFIVSRLLHTVFRAEERNGGSQGIPVPALDRYLRWIAVDHKI